MWTTLVIEQFPTQDDSKKNDNRVLSVFSHYLGIR